MLPLVLELGQDIIWRVRRAVMVSVPLLTERMGVNYFEENLLELYLQVKAQGYSSFFRTCVCILAVVWLLSQSEAPYICRPPGLPGQRQRGTSRRIRRIATTVQSMRGRLVTGEGATAYSRFLRRVNVLPDPDRHPQRPEKAGQRRGEERQVCSHRGLLEGGDYCVFTDWLQNTRYVMPLGSRVIDRPPSPDIAVTFRLCLRGVRQACW